MFARSFLLAGKRRYDRKQSGFGGQTKPVFHKKVRPHGFVSLVVRPAPPRAFHSGKDDEEDRVEVGVQGMQVQDAAAHQALQALRARPEEELTVFGVSIHDLVSLREVSRASCHYS